MRSFEVIMIDEVGDSPLERSLAEKIIRSRHSSLMDRTKRSAKALRLGLLGGRGLSSDRIGGE
jgi:hypothetical protein